MDEEDDEEFDNFELTEFDYIAGGIAAFCMNYMDKEELWNIINHVDNAYEFDTAVQAQETLLECVFNYYESKYNGPAET